MELDRPCWLGFLNRFKDITIYTPTREKQDLSTYDLTNGQSIVHMDWDSNDESSFEAIAAHLKTSEIRLDFCGALGALHSEDHKPEKKLGQITKDQMMWYYNVNAILHSLIIKHFSSLMNKNEPSIMGLLSARVEVLVIINSVDGTLIERKSCFEYDYKNRIH